MFCKYQEDFVLVDKRFGDGRIIPSLPIIIQNKSLAEGSIFDERLTTHYGWIPVPPGLINNARKIALFGRGEVDLSVMPDGLMSKVGDGILLPLGINNLCTVFGNMSYMSDLQKAAYRVISHISSLKYLENNPPPTQTSWLSEYRRLQYAIDQYFQIVMSKLTGKQGLLRKLAYPRQDLSGFSVMTSRIGHINEVHVPITILRKWLMNENYAQKLHLKDMPQNTGEWKTLFKNQHVLLIGMPDHDEKCAFYLKIVPWRKKAIAVHPVVAMTMGRDFDGDLIYLKVFSNPHADEEMKHFTVSGQLENIKESLTKMYAKIDKDTISNEEALLHAVKKVHSQSRFCSTSIKDAAILESATKQKADLFNKLHNGLTKQEMIYMSNTSAIDFSIVKYGTANGGDMGNIIRVISSKLGPRALKYANMYYHIVAQASLNAKHGTTDLTEEISKILRRELPPTATMFKRKIAPLINNQDVTLLLTRIFYNGEQTRGKNLVQMLNDQSKYGSAIRGNCYSLYQQKPENDMITAFMNKSL